MSYNLILVLLGVVQIFWLYKAYKIGGWSSVLNLIGFLMLAACIAVVQDMKAGLVPV